MNRVSLQLATVPSLPRDHISLLPALIHTAPQLQISSSGLLSELAAQSSQPTLNTTPSGRDPVLPRIRVRMPSSSNRSTSG